MFFSDSEIGGYYDSGLAFKTDPSFLAQAGPSGDKLPTSDTALVGRDAVRLDWESREGGGWSALLIAPGFVGQDLSELDSLGFWLYSPAGLPGERMPELYLEGASGAQKSRRYPLQDFTDDLPGDTWRHVAVALDALREDAVGTDFRFDQVKAVIFGQGLPDSTPHTLLVDQVEAYAAAPGRGDAPTQLSALGYQDHVELSWTPGATAPRYYALYREDSDAGQWDLLRLVPGTDTLALVWPGGEAGDRYTFRVGAYAPGSVDTAEGPSAGASLRALSDEEFYDLTQRSTLRYFWDFAHPTSGLARERNTSGNTVTSGGSGFGLMAWTVGVERGWLDRRSVVDQLNETLAFLERADRFHGAWSHWLDGDTGEVIPFSERDNGGDIVETAFLAQGLLTVRQYFDGETPAEDSVRARTTRLWEGIEWDWYVRPGEDAITWHWSPDRAWAIDLKVRGFNETQIVYLLGIASPTHPIPASLYESGWVGNAYTNTVSRYGTTVPVGSPSGGPMFFAHYSYQGFDPRNWRDSYANYFERNELHAEVQVAYGADNPGDYTGYSSAGWGLTASDDPVAGYRVHEAEAGGDNGTLTPTAALASMPYAPAASTEALRYFYSEYGRRVFGPMGFYDAFNPTLDWYATSYLAIDQGPIVNMIENYRSGLLWANFMANPEIAPALEAAGFVPDSTTVGTATPVFAKAGLKVWPNPGVGVVTVRLPGDFDAGTSIHLNVYDRLGRVRQERETALRQNDLSLDLSDLGPGLYYITVRQGGNAASGSLTLQP